MNTVFLILIASSVICAAFTGHMEAVTQETFQAAKGAVNLAIGLVGTMALWLGVVRVAEKGGLLDVLASLLHPVLRRLFPGIPKGHPAMSAMVMNLAANCLGLGNAATPLGIKAMMELDGLNRHKGRATHEMCLFLAINTSSVTLLPLGAIAVRAAAGAKDPAGIIVPTLFATSVSTLAAVVVAMALRWWSERVGQNEKAKSWSGKGQEKEIGQKSQPKRKVHKAKSILALLLMGTILGAMCLKLWAHPSTETIKSFSSYWLVPLLMLGLLLYGYSKGVKVYEEATEGAKEGFNVAIKIIPFLVMILVSVGMFRASGAFDLLTHIISPIMKPLGFPTEVLPVALIRPLSGSGSFALMSEIVARAPDSFNAYLASTVQGSTETTFYVLAVYFGAVGIKNARYALVPALSADLAGALASLFICRIMF